MRNFTKEQNAAIKAEGNLIVSASAGSGKTTVMIENVLKKIEKGADVERMLLLTFTNAAAAEMKEKLRARLIEKIESGGSERLKAQADALDRADICTFHAFCAKLLRNHFENAAFDPSAALADQEDADALFEEALTRVISESEKDVDLLRLREAGSSRGDGALRECIKQIYEFSSSQPFRQVWMEHACDYYDPNKTEALLVEEKRESLRNAYALAFDLKTRYAQAGQEKHAQVFSKMTDNIEALFNVQRVSDWPFFEEIRLPSSKNVADEKLTARAEKIKKIYKEAIKAPEFSKEAQNAALPLAKAYLSLTKRVAEAFEALKKEENVLTFSDLEQKTTRLLEDEASAKRIASEYDYIFVDEFQDTNRVQDYILSKIAKEDNLFVVGDVKQSIYRFRLTEPQLFIDKFQEFSAQKKAIGLNDNFRSAPCVIRAVNMIFERTMTKNFGGIAYEKEAKLIASAAYPEEEGEFCVSALSTEKKPSGGLYSVMKDEGECSLAQAEGRLVAERILSLVEHGSIARFISGECVHSKIEFSDIAVLYQTRADAAVIIEELKACGIPVSSELGSAAYHDFSQVVSFLRVVDNPEQDIPLASALCSYFGGLTEEEAARIRCRYQAVPFYRAVALYKDRESDEIAQKLVLFYEKLEKYRRSLFLDAYTLAKRLVYDEGFDCHLLAGEDGALRYELVRDSLENLPKAKSLSAFLSGGMKKSENNARGGFVTCSTIHASKGLEYPVVFLVNAGKKFNMDYQKSVETDAEYGLGVRAFDFERRVRRDAPLFSFLRRKHEKELKEEKLRLFYVALTRARNRLYISGEYNAEAFQKRALIGQNADSFMDWIAMTATDSALFASHCRLEEVNVQKGKTKEEEISFPLSDEKEERAIRSELAFCYPHEKAVYQGIKYTVTEINKLGEAQEEEKVGRLDFGEGVSPLEGVIYHKVMETLDLGETRSEAVEKHIAELVAQGEIPYVLPDLAKDVIACLKSDAIARAAKGKIYREQKFMLYLPAREILKDGGDDPVLLQGVIDLVSLGEENVIVDYKYTGKSAEQVKALYKKQLLLYARAAEEALGVKIHRKIIYVFGQNTVIEID